MNTRFVYFVLSDFVRKTNVSQRVFAVPISFNKMLTFLSKLSSYCYKINIYIKQFLDIKEIQLLYQQTRKHLDILGHGVTFWHFYFYIHNVVTGEVKQYNLKCRHILPDPSVQTKNVILW